MRDPYKARSSREFCILYKAKYGRDARKTLAKGLLEFWKRNPEIFKREQGETLAQASRRVKNREDEENGSRRKKRVRL